MENSNKNFVTLPGAVIIAGAIIAMAIIFVNKSPATVTVDNNDAQSQKAQSINLSPITADDHIFGNPNAPIKIVEYSDASCPFCKVFNATMVNLMTKYGPTGKVAWVYRSYPLNEIHPNANHEAQALECAADVAGNDKFWAFEKKLYDTTPSITSDTPNGLDQKQLPTIAKAAGIDPVKFNDCLSSGKNKAVVDAQQLTGVNAGVSGTPTSFFVLDSAISPEAVTYISNALIQYRVPSDLLHVSADNKIIFMSGAMPEAMVAGLIDTLLK